MTATLRHDFQNIPEGGRVVLHPVEANLLQRSPVLATRLTDYFYLDGSDPMRMGADYHLGDVAAFFTGYQLAEVTA